MNVVDILISIVVVTILVTIILAIVTYVAYKLRLSREPAQSQDDPTALRYFVRYDPPDEEAETDEAPALERLERDAADLEGHATQT